MKTAIAAGVLSAAFVLIPAAANGDDMDKVGSSSTTFVKDSVLTGKIKARLAEEKIATLSDIKVETDDKGAVRLSGTAKNQAEVAKAGSVAAAVDGVVSVRNDIRVAGAHGAAGSAKASDADRVEARIKDMHTRLQITRTQEDQWLKVAQVMRDNASEMDELTQQRMTRTGMTAIDDLKSYQHIAEAHAEALRKFTPVFETLYDSMSDPQKKNADAIFRHHERKAS